MVPAYFLLALALASAALWVFRQTSEDVYIVLAVSIVLICFIIGFAHAHWIAQTLIALGLLGFTQFYRFKWLGPRKP